MKPVALLLILFGLHSVLYPMESIAQARLFLDVKAGLNYNFAEGAYFGKGVHPLKARYLGLDEQGVLLLRLQLTDRLGLSTGYNGSTLGWGYSLKVPDTDTHNPFEGEWRAHTTGIYMHQLPILINRTIGQYNIREIDTLRHLYLASFKLDIVVGGGINRIGNSNFDGRVSSGLGLYDTIDFKQAVIVRRKWGGFLLGGVTARFYRLGKEKLSLSVYYTQGLTDMLLVPLEYQYNSRKGNTTLHVRGSGLSATLGFPIRLKTFKSPTTYNRGSH